MATINIPEKEIGDTLTNDEMNLIPAAINDNDRLAKKVSHSFSEDHFVESGSTTVPGQEGAVPVVKVSTGIIDLFNSDHFELVGGKISIKAGLLA